MVQSAILLSDAFGSQVAKIVERWSWKSKSGSLQIDEDDDDFGGEVEQVDIEVEEEEEEEEEDDVGLGVAGGLVTGVGVGVGGGVGIGFCEVEVDVDVVLVFVLVLVESLDDVEVDDDGDVVASCGFFVAVLLEPVDVFAVVAGGGVVVWLLVVPFELLSCDFVFVEEVVAVFFLGGLVGVVGWLFYLGGVVVVLWELLFEVELLLEEEVVGAAVEVVGGGLEGVEAGGGVAGVLSGVDWGGLFGGVWDDACVLLMPASIWLIISESQARALASKAKLPLVLLALAPRPTSPSPNKDKSVPLATWLYDGQGLELELLSVISIVALLASNTRQTMPIRFVSILMFIYYQLLPQAEYNWHSLQPSMPQVSSLFLSHGMIRYIY